MTKEYLDLVAYIKDVEMMDELIPCYHSKFDDSYITHVGMEDNVKFLADREITEELTHGVGYSPKDKKWYGWSHRAIFGFEVGSTCKKGDCHFTADNPEEMIDDHANFFSDISQECADRSRAECSILSDRSGIVINRGGYSMPIVNSADELIAAIDDLESGVELPEEIVMDGAYTIKCGRGEWVAETMEDAKQMAIDFNKGVS